MAFRDLVLRWTSEGVQQVTADVDKVDKSTKGLGDETEKLRKKGDTTTAAMRKGYLAVAAAIIGTIAAANKLQQAIDEQAGGTLTAESRRHAMGATWDQYQALTYMGQAGGLGREESAKDIYDMIAALQDKAGETVETGAYDWDFKKAGIDPQQVAATTDPLAMIDYLLSTRAAGPGMGADLDRLMGGDRYAFDAMVAGGVTTDQAMRRAEQIPDPTAGELDEMRGIRQQNAFNEALRDAAKTDLAGGGIGGTLNDLISQAITGALLFAGDPSGDSYRQKPPQRVEVVVDNPAFAIKERNDAGLGYR